MRFHSTGRLLVGLSALAFGLMSCADTSSNDVASSDQNEVDKVASELGEPVTGCSTGGSGFAGTTLTIPTFTGTVVVSAPGGVLKMNGQTCTSAGGAALMVTGTGTSVVKKISMTDAGSGTNAVMLDLFSGPLTTVFAGLSGTGLEVTFAAGSTGTFLVRGTNAVDKVNLGAVGATDLYFDLGLATDGKADVKVTNADAVKISLAGMADVFAPLAAGSALTYNAAALTVIAPPSTPLTIYGGDGDDVITDGPGDDAIFGGAGNDTIKGSSTGTDLFYGGAGTDMIDFGARLAAVAVTANLLISATAKLSGDPAALDTVTIGSKTYTFKAALSGTPTVPEVLFGADADAARANLVAAVMLGAGEGTTYKCAAACSADPLVTAATADSGATVVVTPKDSSSAVITLTEVGAATSWSVSSLNQTASFTGGEADKLYEFENVSGGAGDDVLTGNEGVNLIYGGAGNDTLNGGAGIDTVYGGAGNDIIYGGVGNTVDNLYGELGNDTFWADAAADGIDIVVGGGGTDIMNYSQRTTPVTVTVGTLLGSDDNVTAVTGLVGGTGGDTLAFADTITGALTITAGTSVLANTLTGSAAGTNTITGSGGIDTIKGGALADIIYGNGGNDIIDAKAGNDYIQGGLGDDTITCGAGDDIAYAEEGDDIVYGGDGNDVISGFDGADNLYGDNGDDQITGGIGNDNLYGGAGVDVLNGNAGTNHFIGGAITAGDVCVTLEGTTDVVDLNTCEIF